jgi:hypothetical protein
MKLAALALCSLLLAAAEPKISFTKSFPGSIPPYCAVEIAKDGSLVYKESPTDEQPLKTQLQEPDVTVVFGLAEKLGYFKTPIESGLKVANTGKKTFRYESAGGAASETVFNYSTLPEAQQLLDKFENVAASERSYIALDRAVHFDKLGVNDALAEVESLWLRKELAAPLQFIPLLTRISSHEAFMHLVRDRAAKLKEEFQAPVTADAGGKKEK